MDFNSLWADVHIKSNDLVILPVSESAQDVSFSGCQSSQPLDRISPSLLKANASRLQKLCDR